MKKKEKKVLREIKKSIKQIAKKTDKKKLYISKKNNSN
jgi:hypothetical protein